MLLAGNAKQVDDVAIHVAQQEIFQSLLRQVARSVRDGRHTDLSDRNLRRAALPFLRSRPSRSVRGNDAEDVRGIDNVFRLAADNELVPQQRKVHDAIGERLVDLDFERLVDAVEALLLLRVGNDAHQSS